MKIVREIPSLGFFRILLPLVALMAEAAWATPEKLDIQVGGKSYQVESDDVRQEDVHIARGDTFNDDLVVKAGSVLVDGAVAGDCVVYGGNLTVNGVLLKDAVAFGGSIAVNDSGTVQGDIASFGGPVKIWGTVSSDIASFGGPVELGPASVVNGDIAVMGGKVEKSEGATVRGEIKSLDLGLINKLIPGAMHVSQRRPIFGQMASLIFSLIWMAALAFILLLTVLLFPKNVERVADAAEIDIWKSIGFGVIAQLAFFPALVLLVISILGIILIPLAVLLFLAASILGFAGFSLLVARKFYLASQRPATNRWSQIILGFILLYMLMLFGFAINLLGSPFTILGWILIIADLIILWFALTVGLGAVWTTRFGSQEETARVVS